MPNPCQKMLSFSWVGQLDQYWGVSMLSVFHVYTVQPNIPSKLAQHFSLRACWIRSVSLYIMNNYIWIFFFDRLAFDEDRVPDLTEEIYLQDIHCISSLLKMYFRELPNPLLTYQLYDKFAVSLSSNFNFLRQNKIFRTVL